MSGNVYLEIQLMYHTEPDTLPRGQYKLAEISSIAISNCKISKALMLGNVYFGIPLM